MRISMPLRFWLKFGMPKFGRLIRSRGAIGDRYLHDAEFSAIQVAVLQLTKSWHQMELICATISVELIQERLYPSNADITNRRTT